MLSYDVQKWEITKYETSKTTHAAFVAQITSLEKLFHLCNCVRYVLKHNYTHFSHFCPFLPISTQFYPFLHNSTHFYPFLYPILCQILYSFLSIILHNFKFDMTSSRTAGLAIQVWNTNCSIFRSNCFVYLFLVFLLVENPFTSTKPNIETSIR